jgi:putative ABC transport system permease protein
MFAELLDSVNNDVAKGMFEAAGAIVLCMAVVGLCRHFGLRVERETAISIARGLVQMVHHAAPGRDCVERQQQ